MQFRQERMDFQIDENECYQIKIVMREKMVLTSTKLIYVKSGGVWKKYRSMESFDRELIGEQREEKKTMTGSSLKLAYEKQSSKRKRSEKTNFDNSKKSRTSELSHFTHSIETPSSGENLQMTNTDDKENQNRSIIDDILAEHPMEVMNEDPFDPSASHKSVSTPLKILSPNKRLAMETPDKFHINSPKASPAFKNRIMKNLEAENSYEPTLGGASPRVNIMRVELSQPVSQPGSQPEQINEHKTEDKESPSTSKMPRPMINKDLFNTPTKTPQKTLQKNSPFTTSSPSQKQQSFQQHSSQENTSNILNLSHDDTPIRPWNGDIHLDAPSPKLERSSDRWKRIKLLDQSSRIDEIDESSYMEESIPIEPPELPKRHSSEFLEVDTLIWAKYDDAYYPAFVREILDPRSPKVKVSYCDQEMWERIWSVNISDCLMFTDLPAEFERMVPILARGVDSSLPDAWKDVQVCSCWGMRNYDLSTEEGRAECARSSGYMIKYNHSHFKMIPFGDIAIKGVPGIDEKLKDYFPRKQTITNHNLPDMVTANIIAAPRRKRNSTLASPQVPKPSEKAKFLEGHHFVILKRGSKDFDHMVQGVAEFGGRVVTDIMNFDIKTIKKGETIYCISNEETRSPKYLACLVAQVPVYKQKWIDDMIKQKKFILPSTRKAYTLRDCSKYRPRLFKDTVMKLEITSQKELQLCAKLALTHGAAVTELNAKDFYRTEAKHNHKRFLYVSDGAGKPVIPENGSDLVNIDWLLESILQSKYCKIEDFPIFAKSPAKIPKS